MRRMVGQAPKSKQSGKLSNAFVALQKGCGKAFGCAFFAAIFAASAQAQIAADGTAGGTIRRDVERTIPAPALPAVSPKPDAGRPKEGQPNGETIVVSRFRFTGNTLISDAVLTRSVELYVGRSIDFSELQNAAAMAALAYRDRGYVATVSIPKQELEDGVVTLKVSEARYGGAKIDPMSDGRIHSELILARIEHAMKVEKAVNTNVLDRAVLLLNDLPGASVQSGLAEGRNEGETEVVLQSARKPLVSGSAAVDQMGSLSTGAQRELVDIALNSPTGRGEQCTLSLMHTEGTRYGRAGFSLPVGLTGARAGVNASALEYAVIDGPQVLSKLTGASSSVGADLSYPIVRSQQANLYVSGSVTAKRFDNYARQLLMRSYESQIAAGTLTGNWFDSLLGGASNQASATVSVGRLDIKDPLSLLGDQSRLAGPHTNGEFRKLNASFTRNQALANGWSVFASASAQVASKNLDSSEKFYLGGPNGVRAYPNSEGGGSSGELLQLELRKRLSDLFELRFFHDEGRVRQVVDPYLGNPTPNILHYRGHGLAVIVSLPKSLTLSFAWSRRIGENPNPLPGAATPKRDQDGTLDMDRVWASLSMSF